MKSVNPGIRVATPLREFIPLLVILICLYLISLQNYLLFHSLVELTGIAVAFCIFIIVWNTRRVINNSFFLITGISFLFCAGFDLLHTLAYKGMGVFPGVTSDLPTELWIAARGFQSITLFIAVLCIGKSITKDRRHDVDSIIVTCTFVCTILFASIFWHTFPSCFVEGSGLTQFKIFSEYGISAIFITTIIGLYVKRRAFNPEVWKFLTAALICMILGELAFTSYISVYGFMNMVGHLFRLISVYFFYRAIVVVSLTKPYHLLLRELKENEILLTKSYKMLEGAMDLANLVTWEHDLVSNIFTFNDRFYAFYGTTAECEGGYQMSADVYTRTFVHPEYSGCVIEEAEKALKATDPNYMSQREHKIIRRNGDTRDIIVHLSIIKDGEGQTIKTYGVNQDITARKRSEEAILESNKKLRLLTGLTRHDINNQLTAIHLLLGMVNDSSDRAKIQEYISAALQAGNQIEATIGFTREYENFGISSTGWQGIYKTIETAKSEVSPGNVTIDNQIPIDLEIYADPIIRKVFSTILDNAIRHGGDISTIRFSYYELENTTIIAGEDDGVGIPDEEKEIIFDQGYGKNTGIGLFLSREILSITGLFIQETGTFGKGARFEILVPSGKFQFNHNKDI